MTLVPVSQEVLDRIEGTIACLFDKGLIPNKQAALSKLDAMVSALLVDDFEAAVQAYQDLLGFLDNWQGNNNTRLSDPLDCSPYFAGSVGGAFQQIFDDLRTLWEGIDASGGELCVFSGEYQCQLDEGDVKSMVYFPGEIYSQLTAVYLENNPPDRTSLQNILDEYGTIARIYTGGLSDFSGFTEKPFVAVCFTASVLQYTSTDVLERLLLGSLHLDTEFSLLPRPEGTEEGLLRAQEYCATASTAPSIFGLSSKSWSGWLGNRLATALLPKPLHAAAAYSLAFGGVGGSAEEFSDFQATDPGVTFGGAGGSAEEFAPRAMPGAAASGPAAAVTVSGNRYTGEIDELVSGDQGPRVRIVTPGGTPIVGVPVLFQITDPISNSPKSGAFQCGTTAQGEVVTINTDANGYAEPCVDFGPTPGYVNLQVTFDPGVVDPLACMIDDATESCTTGEASVFFGLETYEAPASFACTAGTKLGKVDFAAYNSSTGTWTGYFSVLDGTDPLYYGRIRQVTVGMSLTGRSSSTSAFGVLLTASVDGSPIASGSTATGQLNLPGDNGSPTNVTFRLTPTEVLNEGQTVLFKMEVQAPSTRAPQLWYRTDKFTGDDCLNAIAYAAGTQPPGATSRQMIAGLVIDVNNTVWTP